MFSMKIGLEVGKAVFLLFLYSTEHCEICENCVQHACYGVIICVVKNPLSPLRFSKHGYVRYTPSPPPTPSLYPRSSSVKRQRKLRNLLCFIVAFKVVYLPPLQIHIHSITSVSVVRCLCYPSNYTPSRVIPIVPMQYPMRLPRCSDISSNDKPDYHSRFIRKNQNG